MENLEPNERVVEDTSSEIIKNSEKEIVETQKKLISDKKKRDFLDILKMFSPGTSLRSCLDDILRARMGALIVIENENLFEIVESGFKINSKFSAQKIVELAKMDGAIILSEDLKRILHANALLFPNTHISTKETGTRHKAAERTAKQAETIVIAVSERKNKITLYYGDTRYELEISSEVLRRAAESLQILEKQKEIFNDLMSNLNMLEMNNLVIASDVCEVLQKIEIIRRISEKIKRYLVELGKEGIIVSMRLKELIKNLNKTREMILKDYFKNKFFRVDTVLKNMNFDLLLDTSNILKVLFEGLSDKSISSRGWRILNKTNLSEKDIGILIKKFKILNDILESSKESLVNVLKDEKKVDLLKQDLGNLREKILVGKNI